MKSMGGSAILRPMLLLVALWVGLVVAQGCGRTWNVTESECGDGMCEPLGESCASCAEDCGACVCGNTPGTLQAVGERRSVGRVGT